MLDPLLFSQIRLSPSPMAEDIHVKSSSETSEENAVTRLPLLRLG